MKTAHKLLLMFSGAIAPPPAPTSLAITGASGGIVADLTPEATADVTAGATTYEFEVALTSVGLTGTPTITGLATPAYTFSTLLNFTSYIFAIRARNAAGPGPWSAGVTVMTALYGVNDTYTTDRAAGAINGTATEPGPGGNRTAIDTLNRLSLSSSVLISASQSDLSLADNIVRYASVARVAGRAVKILRKKGSSGNSIVTGGFTANASQITGGHTLRTAWVGSSTLDVDGGIGTGYSEVASNDYEWDIVLQDPGAYYFVKGGAFTSRTLFFVETTNTATPLYPALNFYRYTSIVGVDGFDYVRVADLPAPFTTAQGIATLSVASPSVTDYTGTADQVLDLTLTAPGSITTEAGIIYRKLDASNYWRAYFDTAGALKVDSVSGGTPTNRINVAGVIAAGQTRTIRVICQGSLNDAFSLSGSTWTKRGSQINVSHQNTQTTVQPDIGAGWTAANLRSYPRTSSQYTILDSV